MIEVGPLQSGEIKLASPPSLPETLAEIHHKGASGRLASVKITVAVAGLW
jgi:hypothetical protein